jgi:hypothetical protein
MASEGGTSDSSTGVAGMSVSTTDKAAPVDSADLLEPAGDGGVPEACLCKRSVRDEHRLHLTNNFHASELTRKRSSDLPQVI